MAVVDNVTYNTPTGRINYQEFRCQLTGATSTITEATHRFGSSIGAVNISVEGTNTMTWTRSGTTITVTGTDDDWINVRISGN